MMNQQHIEISDRDKFKQILFLNPSNQVVLTIKLLDAAESKYSQDTINKSLQTCGCGEAAFACFVADQFCHLVLF